MNERLLNTSWRLHEAPLDWDADRYEAVKKLEEGWLPCALPVDIHIPLIEAGIIKDPVLADYCRESEWTENRSWWFFKDFSWEDDGGTIAELVLEGLDAEAAVFLNGELIGRHHSVHYPFVCEVKHLLRPGENELAVRLTSGLEKVTPEMLSELNWAVSLESYNGGKYRGDARRAFVRRPQFTIGWDWGPKVVTCGITGDVKLRSYREVAIREVSVVTESVGEAAQLSVEVDVEDLDWIASKTCELAVELYDGETLCASQKLNDLLLTSGPNYIKTTLTVPNPKLWWPAGYGEQPLYTVRVSAVCRGETERYPDFRYGIRTLRLDTSPLSGDDRRFTVIVNGLPVFCKGSNWIPNDSLYARVPREKYEFLLDEAKEANFNMLRVWGGGLYEREYFYEMCTERGILIWQDFMFACATYPDHRESFCELIRREMDFQTKRLRNYACMALFCGTNECHWLFNETENPKWKIRFRYGKQYGLTLPNVFAKEAIRRNCPQIPYWNSSPYGGELPNDDSVGDIHRWQNAFMSKKLEERMDLEAFDAVRAKFVSEYGCVGPCCAETTRQYLDLKEGEEVVREGPVWEMHLNVFERGNVCDGIRKHYLDHPEELPLDDYILYGGMVHATMLGYSLEALRFLKGCSGALFWMFNDTWGEVGWTIVDYYLRRKIGYYAVKRALAHRKLSLRRVGESAVLQGINDTSEEVRLRAELGYFSFDGKRRESETVELVLPPHSRAYLCERPLEGFDLKRGVFAVLPSGDEIAPAALRTDDMRNLVFDTVPVTVKKIERKGADAVVTVASSAYAHGVYVKGNCRCSDSYFDLLPGEEKTFTVYDCPETPVICQVR